VNYGTSQEEAPPTRPLVHVELACARTLSRSGFSTMHIHVLPRCTTITTKAKRCKLTIVPGNANNFCRYHCGGEITKATHAKNREGERRYWAAWRAAKAASVQLPATPKRRVATTVASTNRARLASARGTERLVTACGAAAGVQRK
jgi:hypothetical protein